VVAAVTLLLLALTAKKAEGQNANAETTKAEICAIGIEHVCPGEPQPIVFKMGESRADEQRRLENEKRREQARLASTSRQRAVSPPAVPADRESIAQLIRDAASRYGISDSLPLAIARCESGFNPSAKNRSSTASGTFQYLAGTWANTPEGRAGESVFDAEANIEAAVRHIAKKGTSPWNASKACWSH